MEVKKRVKSVKSTHELFAKGSERFFRGKMKQDATLCDGRVTTCWPVAPLKFVVETKYFSSLEQFMNSVYLKSVFMKCLFLDTFRFAAKHLFLLS